MLSFKALHARAQRGKTNVWRDALFSCICGQILKKARTRKVTHSKSQWSVRPNNTQLCCFVRVVPSLVTWGKRRLLFFVECLHVLATWFQMWNNLPKLMTQLLHSNTGIPIQVRQTNVEEREASVVALLNKCFWTSNKHAFLTQLLGLVKLFFCTKMSKWFLVWCPCFLSSTCCACNAGRGAATLCSWRRPTQCFTKKRGVRWFQRLCRKLCSVCADCAPFLQVDMHHRPNKATNLRLVSTDRQECINLLHNLSFLASNSCKTRLWRTWRCSTEKFLPIKEGTSCNRTWVSKKTMNHLREKYHRRCTHPTETAGSAAMQASNRSPAHSAFSQNPTVREGGSPGPQDFVKLLHIPYLSWQLQNQHVHSLGPHPFA